MKKTVLLALAVLLLAGCSADKSPDTAPAAESTSLQQESDSVETTESTDPLKLASDEELIEAVINSRALEAWSCSSAFASQSAEGIKYLADICPEFKELLIRDSGLQSLRGYGLQIAEEYREHEEARYRLRGLNMKWLLAYLFPDMAIDLTK